MNDMNGEKPARRKGITSLTLHWIAEKLRRADRIKEQLSSGTYQVDSDKVAQAIVNTNNSQGDGSNR